MRRLSLAMCLLALACGEREEPAPATQAGANRLAARPCWFEMEAESELRAECAELRVPERWDAPDGAREVRIPVVMLRTGSQTRWATLIPGGGGPGGSVGLESDDARTTVANH